MDVFMLNLAIIQTITVDDTVKISRMNELTTYRDQTLSRIEVGGNYHFNDSIYGYSWGNYTYGSSYDSFSAGIGISYTWQKQKALEREPFL